jgi:hypothetical protein
MSGGKTIPDTVADKPRLFITLTAPSFGAVHGRRTTRTGKTIPCGCGEYHHTADPRTGTAIDPDTYDYRGAVLWQGHSGDLWHAFTIRLRRELAMAAGIKVADFPKHARLSYATVAEYQKRGLIHFHAVIRLDGPEGPEDPAPGWADSTLIEHDVRAAAETATVTQTLTINGDTTEHVFRWGAQVDVRAIRPAHAAQVEGDDGEISDRALAGYIAKYATKGASTCEVADRPIRSERAIGDLTVHPHHRRMITAAWDLGANEDVRFLRKWAHMLGFRGHFLTKSRRYSTTFGEIRRTRAEYRLDQEREALGLLDFGDLIVVNDWEMTGLGYRNPAERQLAGVFSELHLATRRLQGQDDDATGRNHR